MFDQAEKLQEQLQEQRDLCSHSDIFLKDSFTQIIVSDSKAISFDCLSQQHSSTAAHPIQTKNQQYEQFLNSYTLTASNRSRLQALLTNHGISLTSQSGEPELRLTVLNHTQNYEIMEFAVVIGHFSLQLLVLNVEGKSKAHDLNNISSTFSNVFITGAVAIKCCSTLKLDFSSAFLRVVKEYSLLKIASFQQMGPVLDFCFGFDLIIYDDCIQFAMENCQNLPSLLCKKMPQLFYKLRALHELQFVHLDIKPANISFSSRLNQPVFIDFGLSEVLPMPKGTLTNYGFVGSLSYCSPQMVNLYNSQSAYSVDLYYNDLHCLQKACKQITEQMIEKNKTKGLFDLNQSDYPYDWKDQIKAESQFLYFKAKFLVYLTSISVLQNKTLRSCILSTRQRREDFYRYLSLLPYTIYLEALIIFLESNDPLLNAQSFPHSNLQNRKQMYYFSTPLLCESQFSFKYRVSRIATGAVIRNPHQARSNIQFNVNIREIVLRTGVNLHIKKQVYFQAFLKFVDKMQNQATSDDKNEAIALMAKYCQIAETCESRNSVLGACLKHILNFVVDNLTNRIQVVIPLVFCNLIILQELSNDQIINFLERIVDLPMNPTSLSLLLFRCQLACDWIDNRVSSRYKETKISAKIYKIVFLAVKRIVNDRKVLLILHLMAADKEAWEMNQNLMEMLEIIRTNFEDLEQSIRVELIIYYLSILLKISWMEKSPLAAVHIIESIKYFSNKLFHCENFQYYHFRVYNFFKNLGNSHLCKMLHKTLANCLKNEFILSCFSIDLDILSMKFENGEISTNNYLGILIKKGINCKEALLKINMLLTKIGSNLSTTEASLLRTVFTFQILINIPFPLNDSENQISAFYERCLTIMQIYYFLYSPTQQVYQKLASFFIKLQMFWSSIICTSCKQQAFIFLSSFEGYLYHRNRNYNAAIQVYQQVLIWLSHNQKKNQVHRMTFLYMILNLVIIGQQVADKQVYFADFLAALRNNDQYHALLTDFNSRNFFNFVSWYLVIRNNKMEEYFHILRHLSQFLFHYPARDYIIRYASYISAFMMRNTSHQSKILAHLDSEISSSFRFPTHKYLIVFYSICLRFNSEWNWNLVKIICENVSLIAFVGKRIVLANLYWHIVRCIYTGQPVLKSQKLAFSSKSYFRYGLIRLKYLLRYGNCCITYRDFADRFGKHFDKDNSFTIKKYINFALQSFYRCVMTDSEETTKIDLSLASPFNNQTCQ